MRRIKFKSFSILIIVFALFFLSVPLSMAADSEPEPKALVVFSSPDNKISSNLRNLDMLLNHFTTNFEMKNIRDLEEKDTKKLTHLVYFGEVSENLPTHALKIFDQYEGKKILFGYNHHQFSEFQYVQGLQKTPIDELILSSTKSLKLETDHEKFDIRGSQYTQQLLSAKYKGQTYPLFINHHSTYYYADHDLSIEDSIILGEALHEVFEVQHDDTHKATIRLEDVTPILDSDLLKKCADLLFENQIPFSVSVTPVYYNPSTGERYTLADSPSLVEVLREIQGKGGRIILHGYTDQSGNRTSGDGFEFQDTALNSDFLKERIVKGIEELHKHGLEPVAFESPHYMMTENGYQVVSNYFSTYIGQLQLDDTNWRVMEESPFITKPSFLSGMTLLPETLRYMKEGERLSLDEIKTRAERLSITRDGFMSGFYHPYLGVEGLEQMIQIMDKTPNLEWVDIKSQVSKFPSLKEATGESTEEEPQVKSVQIIKQDHLLTLSFQWHSIIAGSLLSILVIAASYIITVRIRKED